MSRNHPPQDPNEDGGLLAHALPDRLVLFPTTKGSSLRLGRPESPSGVLAWISWENHAVLGLSGDFTPLITGFLPGWFSCSLADGFNG